MRKLELKPYQWITPALRHGERGLTIIVAIHSGERRPSRRFLKEMGLSVDRASFNRLF